MFREARPTSIKVAVQKDLEQYSERSELGNKDLHLTVVSEEPAEVEPEPEKPFDQVIIDQFS